MGELDVKKNAEQAETKEKGAALVEYALLVALIAVICIAALKFLGGTISTEFSQLGSTLSAETN
ncbi:MAG: Flp family type IVb pilin [Bdellovibrionota bacterium]|nr:MAG: Flp family type IVb pilin [Bdellovibrionota bacterium]